MDIVAMCLRGVGSLVADAAPSLVEEGADSGRGVDVGDGRGVVTSRKLIKRAS